jgi:hypothetical protein
VFSVFVLLGGHYGTGKLIEEVTAHDYTTSMKVLPQILRGFLWWRF